MSWFLVLNQKPALGPMWSDSQTFVSMSFIMNQKPIVGPV